MKRFMIVMAIGTVLVTASAAMMRAPSSANAASNANLNRVAMALASYTWDGGGGDDDWDTEGNWSIDGIPICITPDDAVIGDNLNGTPELSQNKGVRHFDMNDDAVFDTNGSKLFVTGIATFEDVDNDSTVAAMTVDSTHGELETAGFLTASQLVFKGGYDGITVTVVNGATVQSVGTASCPP